MENEIKISLNENIRFDLSDVYMNQLLGFLNDAGILRMDCNKCGLTVLPQTNAHFNATAEEEFKVKCVGCGNIMRVRRYSDYGFVYPDNFE